MKKPPGKTALTICVVAGMCWTTSASAVVVPVIDAANLFSNVVQNFQLKAIKQALSPPDEGGQTINYYTKNIDVSITKNTEVNNEFTWIINKEDENVPIPEPVNAMMRAILGGEPSDVYSAKFQSVDHYVKLREESAGQGEFEEIGLDGSRARKAANDALVAAIEAEQKGLGKDADSLKEWMGDNINAQGHGRQLQVANSLAHTQVNQLMKLRSMMLASEAARAVEAQSAADKEARAMAKSKAMRNDIHKYTHVAAPPPMF